MDESRCGYGCKRWMLRSYGNETIRIQFFMQLYLWISYEYSVVGSKLCGNYTSIICGVSNIIFWNGKWHEMELKTTYFLNDRATDEVHKEQGVTWLLPKYFKFGIIMKLIASFIVKENRCCETNGLPQQLSRPYTIPTMIFLNQGSFCDYNLHVCIWRGIS